MAEEIEVEIFGQTFRIAAAGASPEYIQRLAAYVDERMQVFATSVKSLPLHRLAVLTALNIADDLLKLQDRYGQLSCLLNAKADHLISLVHEQLMDE